MPNWRRPIIFFLLFLSGSKIFKNLKEIKKIEKLSSKELEVYQLEKLKKLLLYAYENVPYYHKILKKADVVNKDQSVNLDNFKKIPFLTKKILAKEEKNVYSRDHQNMSTYLNSSGGSSGEPIHILQTKDYSDWNIANKIYYKTFVGQKIGDKELRLWGSERDTMGEKPSPSKRFKDFLYNRKDLNAFNMTEASMLRYIEIINKFRPTWIEAYASSMYELSIFAKKHKLKMFSPKGVLVSAGTLYPYMRSEIEKVFNTKIFNRYGSREVGDLACTCSMSKKPHISIWNNYIEIIKESPKSKLGKVYITNLNNYAMPIIRYDISDLASFSKTSKCKCGRETPQFSRIEGRETSVFRNKNGDLIPAEFFIHFVGVVFNNGDIKKFQVIQEDFLKIVIKYVSEKSLNNSRSQKRVNSIIKKTMGKNCSIEWKRVKKIPSLSSGKYVYTISKVGKK